MKKNNDKPKLRFPGFNDPWEQRKLGELADIVRGASPRPIQDPKWFNENSEVGWLRIADVTEQDGRIHHLEQHISELGQEKTRVLTKPHLLISIAATVGKPVVNYVKTGVHDGFLIFQNPKFDREFMFQWLEMFRPMWQKYGQPGSQVNLNSNLVKNQDIMLPSEDEQAKIGQFFSELDNLVTLHQRKLNHLQDKKKSLLQKMFPKNDEDFPELRFPGFTDPWEQRKLKQLANFAKGQGYSKNDLTDVGTPIILYGRLYTKYQSSISEVDTFAVPQSGSVYSTGEEVIVPASGETAEDIARASAVVKSGFLLGGDLNIIYPNKDISTIFLALSISNGKQQKELSKKAQGKSVVHVHNSDLEEVTISFPCKEEQEKIESVFAHLDNLITLHQRKLNHLQEQKKALLQQMFI
ncbi:restriction endonuclease subunit S [Clostridium tyrobutyricum]|jgi:type I restriction enzyme S subunit|uniref:restriction endonuclease subunit S n=1 Tax=Clostridium tyrobutyricum TaxID=1519 RepID=UPI0010A9DAE7|nr:restriction endonuclease subunit S [Clostridium tyrobutyricum]MBV4449179.1 restriction endonuclease subunit S [Clostridium tyrobutyricum]QCH27769.1 Type I restriction modification DNA specificity domain protein [Clostridium tyrobutyricum]